MSSPVTRSTMTEPGLRRRPASRAWGTGAALALVLFLLSAPHSPTLAQNSQQQCPTLGEMSPCLCTLKKNGLDVLCEATEGQHIQNAMAALKRKPNTVIYYLKLRHNLLPKLHKFIFLGLDIRHLTIHNSSLALVEESSLSSVGTGLTQLDLSQNALNGVPSVALKTLHHLLILNLNHNKINVIGNRAFEGLDTLEILSVYENKISAIDPHAFQGLEKKLKRLNLGGNELTHIPKEALSTLEYLKKLEMQENRIPEIRVGELGAGLRNLDSLNMQHNYLKQVPANVFQNLTMLNSLELENNHIKYVDPDAFVGLEGNLQYLRLGDNKLDAIPSKALSRLHRLRHLDLRANNITTIAEDAFTGFGDSITFLNLQKNSILTLPSGVFENLNSLETVNLQFNRLEYLPEEMMEPIHDTLQYIDISDNPLKCTCDLMWYKKWYKTKFRPDETTALLKKHTVCYLKSDHNEYHLLSLPLDKMSCAGKNMGQTSFAEPTRTNIAACLTTTFFGCALVRSLLNSA